MNNFGVAFRPMCLRLQLMEHGAVGQAGLSAAQLAMKALRNGTAFAHSLNMAAHTVMGRITKLGSAGMLHAKVHF